MQKIPTLFVRNPDNMAKVLDEVNPACKWVLDGEGVATRKYDGTCVMVDADGKWWARREVKRGKAAPPNFLPADHDEVTGKTVGWEPSEQSPFSKFLTEALTPITTVPAAFPPGTYELIGPKINGNPEEARRHRLVYHKTAERLIGVPLDFYGLREFVTALGGEGIEGIVWHHPDGRVAKLKAKDF